MSRRTAALLAGAAAVIATVALPALPAQAATGSITGIAGKCVDVAGANSANGTAVQLYDCNGSGAQQWNVVGNGQIQALGKCLDVSGGGTANGTVVQLYDCNGTGAQNWTVSAAHDIVNVAANKCLDASGNSSANGTRLQIWDCSGGANQKWNAPGSGGGGGGGGSFVVSEAQFNSLFPNRNGFYTYGGLVSAMSAFPAFATTGSDTVKKQEAAAFLANVAHETGNLVYITEIDKSGNYCDTSQWYGCPAGTYSYYGRGPLQLSWNFNYKAAGDYLGTDLLDNPWLVEQDSAVAWKTGLWYWFTGTGAGNVTSHNAMVNGNGFGATIRAINGGLECDGKGTGGMQDRVNNYNHIVGVLGVPAGNNLYC